MQDPREAKALYNAAGESRVVYNETEEQKARAAGFTHGYKFREYPKSLYQGGERSGKHRVVASESEERAARKDGYKMLDADLDKAAAARLAPAEEPAAEKKGKK